MIQLPRLLDENLKEKARLSPVKLAIHQRLSGLSTAEMILPLEENALHLRDLVKLYDENASCHMALGRGFDVCVKDYEKYTKDELKELGINDSMIHVDFMIGSRDLDITGIMEDGTEVPVFRNGTWAI